MAYGLAISDVIANDTVTASSVRFPAEAPQRVDVEQGDIVFFVLLDMDVILEKSAAMRSKWQCIRGQLMQ